MAEYREDERWLVTWVMPVGFDDDGLEITDAVEAAQQALTIMRDPESIATYFQVTDAKTGKTVNVDLMEYSGTL
jgi:hypothetical protein